MPDDKLWLVDGTLIDESDRVDTTLLRLHVLHVLPARSCPRVSLCSSQRSMRRVRPFKVLNNNVVFINGKIKRTSNVAFEIIRGFVHQLFIPRS